MTFDLKSIPRMDLYALIAGGVALILSLFGAYVVVSVEAKGAAAKIAGDIGYSAGHNAWTSFATLGMLLILVATALVAVRIFASQVLPAGVPWNLITLAVAALGTVLLILRVFTFGGGGSSSMIESSTGPGWSGWLLMLSTIALTVFTALTFKSSGEKIPRRSASTA